MKVLLIKPPWHIFQGFETQGIPLGLCCLASVLRDAGHCCLILDGDLGISPDLHARSKMVEYDGILIDHKPYQEALTSNHKAWMKIEEVFRKFKPDIVGITMATGMYGAALRAAKIVKDIRPNIPLVVGGPHPTILPEDTLKEDYIDIVVKGEGEFTMLDLIDHIDDGKPLTQVCGISYKDRGIIHHNSPRPLIEDLDSLPFPARDLIFEKERYTPDSFGYIITSRGCPFNCVFCSSHKIWGRKVRYRSPNNIVEEIKEVMEKFNTRLFRFNDDTFTINADRAFKICELIINEGLEIQWYCDTRVELLTADLLEQMKRAGCIRIDLGVESGNPQILNFTKKGITLEQARQTINEVKKAGIKAQAYFMMGFPGEGKKEILDSITFMRDAKPDYTCWSIVTPYPGTELYDISKEKGLLPKDLDWSTFFHHHSNMGVSDRLSKKDFLEMIREIIRTKNDLYANLSNVKDYLLNPSQFFFRVKLYLRNFRLFYLDFRYIISAILRKQ